VNNNAIVLPSVDGLLTAPRGPDTDVSSVVAWWPVGTQDWPGFQKGPGREDRSSRVLRALECAETPTMRVWQANRRKPALRLVLKALET
jgi:hypothetical protein